MFVSFRLGLGVRACVDVAVFVSCPSGYVQGMSDLLSPVLYVMENEVDALDRKSVV